VQRGTSSIRMRKLTPTC